MSTVLVLGLSQQVGDLVSGAFVPLQSRVCQHSQGRRATVGKVAGPAGFGQTLSPAQPRATPSAAKEGW